MTKVKFLPGDLVHLIPAEGKQIIGLYVADGITTVRIDGVSYKQKDEIYTPSLDRKFSLWAFPKPL